jgi:tRNA pseudouridine32 synthase/23S rRNA pseudouridine746 synthase
MTGEELLARVLHRDPMMLVIDKPAGLPVHVGPRAAEQRGPVLEPLFGALRFGLPNSPSLAHRLDRDTSGCLILGRHRKALVRLMDLFKAGTIDKAYWAVVEGDPESDEGLIDLPLGRLDPTRGWWMKVDPAGLPSQTRWKVLGRGQDEHGRPLAFVELEPLTGRTHQLRVHCRAMGWPILGDPIYGHGPRFGEPRLHLHARFVRVPIDPAAPPVEVMAPPPDHMRAALAACGHPAT